MAKDTGMYSMTQFQVAIKAETNLGTANVTAMQYVNIDGYPSISRNCERFLDVRHGAGRTAKLADVYVSQYGSIKEISWTGFYDQTIAPMLLCNCTGVAVGTSPESYDVAYNYTGVECAHGDTDNDNTGALTIALVSPEGSTSMIFPGCFVDSFKMYAESTSDGGRLKYDVIFKTRHNISTAQAAPTTPSAYATTYRTIHDLATTQLADVTTDLVLNKFELTLNSQVKFYGVGANGIPNTIGRGMPEFIVTGLIGAKFDAGTVVWLASQLDEFAGGLAIEISNNATWASATFGFKGSYAEFQSEFDPSDFEGGAYVDIPLKFMAYSSGDVIQIVP